MNNKYLRAKNVETDSNTAKLSGIYTPQIDQSIQFVAMTGDKNNIHNKEIDGKVIMPGFLQTCFGKVQADRLFRTRLNSKVDISQFPYVSMSPKLEELTISGLSYDLTIEISSEPEPTAKVKISREGKPIYSCDIKYSKESFEEEVINLSNWEKHELIINNNTFPEIFTQKAFSNITGAEYPIETLHAIASSFNALFDGIDRKKFPPLPERLGAIYQNQEIFYRGDLRPNLKKGITLETYIDDPKQFGVKRGEVFNMTIARNHEGEILYQIITPLTFVPSKLMTKPLIRIANASKNKETSKVA